MKANRKRLFGFYWVRFEGDLIVAEYSDGDGCTGSSGPHWHVPASPDCFYDREVSQLVAGPIPRPVPADGADAAQSGAPEVTQQ